MIVIMDGGQFDTAELERQGYKVENRGTPFQPNLVVNGTGIGNSLAQARKFAATPAPTKDLSALSGGGVGLPGFNNAAEFESAVPMDTPERADARRRMEALSGFDGGLDALIAEANKLTGGSPGGSTSGYFNSGSGTNAYFHGDPNANYVIPDELAGYVKQHAQPGTFLFETPDPSALSQFVQANFLGNTARDANEAADKALNVRPAVTDLGGDISPYAPRVPDSGPSIQPPAPTQPSTPPSAGGGGFTAGGGVTPIAPTSTPVSPTPTRTGITPVAPSGNPFESPTFSGGGRTGGTGGGTGGTTTGGGGTRNPGGFVPPSVDNTGTGPAGPTGVPGRTGGFPYDPTATPNLPTTDGGPGGQGNGAPGSGAVPGNAFDTTQRDNLFDTVSGSTAPTYNWTGLTPIDPANSLRGQQINPVNSQNLNTVNQQMVDRVTALPSGVGRTQIQGTDLSGARSQLARASSDLGNARLGGYTPIGGTDLSGARNYLGDAASQVGNIGQIEMQEIAPGQFSMSDEAARARELSSQGLESLNLGPDRLQLALDAFELFRQERDPEFQQASRRVGQQASALGRVGAGMTTNQLTDLETLRQETMDREQARLINNALSQIMEDRRANLGLTLGAGDTLLGQDLAVGGFQQGLRNEGRAEREAGQQTALRNADLALASAGLSRGLASDEAGLAQIGRRDAESDRAFDLSRDTTAANLALSRVNAGRGLASDEAGLAQITRGDAESDRAYDLTRDTTNANLALQSLGATGSVSDRLFGQEATGRNELRTERDFQDRLARQSVEDQIRQAIMEEQFMGNSYQRELERQRLLAAIAAIGSGDPAQTMLAAANQVR